MPNIQYATTNKRDVVIVLTAVLLTSVAGKAAELEQETQPCSSTTIEPSEEIQFVTESGTAQWAKFQSLVRQWREERGAMSSITEMSMLPAYQKIIGMGPDALPLIVAELKSEGDDPDQWFWALMAISETSPAIKPEDQGNFRKMAQAWLELAEKGYAG